MEGQQLGFDVAEIDDYGRDFERIILELSDGKAIPDMKGNAWKELKRTARELTIERHPNLSAYSQDRRPGQSFRNLIASKEGNVCQKLMAGRNGHSHADTGDDDTNAAPDSVSARYRALAAKRDWLPSDEFLTLEWGLNTRTHIGAIVSQLKKEGYEFEYGDGGARHVTKRPPVEQKAEPKPVPNLEQANLLKMILTLRPDLKPFLCVNTNGR